MNTQTEFRQIFALSLQWSFRADLMDETAMLTMLYYSIFLWNYVWFSIVIGRIRGIRTIIILSVKTNLIKDRPFYLWGCLECLLWFTFYIGTSNYITFYWLRKFNCEKLALIYFIYLALWNILDICNTTCTPR